MKASNIRYIATVEVGDKTVTTRFFVTEEALSRFANRMYSKYGDDTTVVVYDFNNPERVVCTYHA